jgi:hypothetical protein
MPSTFVTTLLGITTEFHGRQKAARSIVHPRLGSLVLRLMLSIFICGWLSTTFAQSNTQLTPAEHEVLTQVGLGKEVDLQSFAQGQDGQGQERGEISAEFLVSLLVNEAKEFKITSEGITIKNALIRNKFNLGNRTIPANVTFENCVFQDNVGFGMSNFERSLTIKDSIFTKEASFSDLRVAYFVDMTNTQFNGDNIVYFDGIKIDGDFLLQGAQFKSNADFTSADIARKLDLSKAAFLDAKNLADFDGLNADSMTVEDTIFQGTANFWAVTIKRDLNIRGAKFLNPEKMADFSGSNIGHDLLIKGSIWPASSSSLMINDLSYQNIVPDDESSLDFIRRSIYNEEAYEHLEDYYRRLGRGAEADSVYIEYRWKQTEKSPWYERIGSYLLKVLVGYGRRPWRTLLLSLIFIAVGTIIFWRERDMETQRTEEQNRYQKHYSPFWYSLATFLPFVQLEDAQIWRPSVTTRFARTYLRIHVILGYLLVPIGLAAWTGIIK